MRRMRTVVFPVPAPASTSMGPLTCSIASRCCGSGWNLELEAPLETAIEGRIAELEKEKMPSKYQTATQAVCYIGPLIFVWMTMSAVDGSEFVGGRITGPLFNLSDTG